MRVVEEGIVEKWSDVDMSVIFGYAFPKTKGGPLFYARQVSLFYSFHSFPLNSLFLSDGLPNSCSKIRTLPESLFYWYERLLDTLKIVARVC